MHTTAGRDALLAKDSSEITHIGLLTGVTDWRAGTVTEANYTGYARAAVTFGSPANATPASARQIANSVVVSFPTNTGANQDIIAYGLYTASSGGVLRAIGLIDALPPVVGTVDAITDLITAYGHGLTADHRVFMQAAPIGAAPDVFAENVAYYVLAAGLTADKFALSLTSGGAAINTTTSGIAMFMPYKAQTIAGNSTPSFAIGQAVIQI